MTIPTSIISRPAIDIAHHRIHEGNHFLVHRITTVVFGSSKYFLIIPPPLQTTGSTVEIHLIFEVSSDVGGTLEFFENSTATTAGATGLNPINNNRRSISTSLTYVFENPAVTADGTLLFEERGGSAALSSVSLGEFERDDEEIILNPIYMYLLKFTPFAAANITMELNWYDNRPGAPVPIP